MNVKIWKDSKGFALEFEYSKFELTHEAFGSLVHELHDFQDEHVADDDSILKEIELDLDEAD